MGSLLPREHGAYGQLLFPIVSGLVMGHPGAASFGCAVAAILFFLAYEPLAIKVGIRGSRARRTEGGAASRRLLLLVPPAAAAGIVAWLAAPAGGRGLLLLPAGWGVVLVLLVLARRAKSLAGEIAMAAAFSSLHVPIGYGGGLRGAALWGPALTWFLVFVLSTLVVHAIKDRQSGRKSLLPPLTDGTAMLALMAAIVLASKSTDLRWLAIAAVVPVLAVVVVNFGRLTARHLKRIGWTLVVSDLVALLVLTFAR